MFRAFYSLLMVLGQPLLRRKLRRRGVNEPGYLEKIDERFGRYDLPESSGSVWIHSVSLGETRAAAILLAELRKQWPGMRLLLTHGTATGRAEGAKLLKPGDIQVWQPWDTQSAARKFVRHFKPAVGVLMETEIWPNLLAECKAQGVPVVLANARLNERSYVRADQLSGLSEPAYKSLAAVYAQTEADADRLRALGANVQGVFGNLKFDATPDAFQLARGREWAAMQTRPVVMFASSREGEEKQFVEAVKAWREHNPATADAVQWLIVPRHPQRFDEAARLVADAGFTLSRRSAWSDAPQSAQMWLGDSLGEMALYYGLSGAALLGGSFEPLGGQNLIEAAACGCPVIMGPSTFNFEEAANLALQEGAAQRVQTLQDATSLAAAWVHDSAGQADRAAKALSFARAHQGAAAKTASAMLCFPVRA